MGQQPSFSRRRRLAPRRKPRSLASAEWGARRPDPRADAASAAIFRGGGRRGGRRGADVATQGPELALAQSPCISAIVGTPRLAPSRQASARSSRPSSPILKLGGRRVGSSVQLREDDRVIALAVARPVHDFVGVITPIIAHRLGERVERQLTERKVHLDEHHRHSSPWP